MGDRTDGSTDSSLHRVRYVSIRAGGPTLHVREWCTDPPIDRDPPFLLVHGLASNARTWDGVARRLAAAGHHVIAVDQRGHGLSDKPDGGYDFSTVTEDLDLLLNRLEIRQPIMVGQSWGGNVALAFGARYAGRTCGLSFIDGGFIDMQMRPDSSWEEIAVQLRPPSLAGTPLEDMRGRLRHFHPDWSDEAVDSTLANFEVLPDGAIRPWLSLDRHMLILRALWEQRPAELFPRIQEPVLIAAASDARNPVRMEVKRQQVAAASEHLATSVVEWFDETDHDIHVQRPERLAALLLRELADGIWANDHLNS